jgi:hypothetical protein
MAPIEAPMPDLWPHVLEVVESFCRTGVLETNRRIGDEED